MSRKPKNESKQPEASAPVESLGEKIKHAASDLIEQVTGHKSEDEKSEDFEAEKAKEEALKAEADKAKFEQKNKTVAGSDFEGHPKLNKFKKGN